MTLQDKDQLWLHSRTFSAISIAVAAVCLSCMLVVLGWGTHLTVKAVQSGKLWSALLYLLGRRHKNLTVVDMLCKAFGLTTLELSRCSDDHNGRLVLMHDASRWSHNYDGPLDMAYRGRRRKYLVGFIYVLLSVQVGLKSVSVHTMCTCPSCSLGV